MLRLLRTGGNSRSLAAVRWERQNGGSSGGRDSGSGSLAGAPEAERPRVPMSAGAGVGFAAASNEDYGCHVRASVKYVTVELAHQL